MQHFRLPLESPTHWLFVCPSSPPDSVTVIVQASSQALNGAATATSDAVARAAARVCTGGNVQAAAQAAAQVRVTCRRVERSMRQRGRR